MWNSKNILKFSKKFCGIYLKLTWNSHKNYFKFTLKLYEILLKSASNSLENFVKIFKSLSKLNAIIPKIGRYSLENDMTFSLKLCEISEKLCEMFFKIGAVLKCLKSFPGIAVTKWKFQSAMFLNLVANGVHITENFGNAAHEQPNSSFLFLWWWVKCTILVVIGGVKYVPLAPSCTNGAAWAYFWRIDGVQLVE